MMKTAYRIKYEHAEHEEIVVAESFKEAFKFAQASIDHLCSHAHDHTERDTDIMSIEYIGPAHVIGEKK